MKFWGGTGNSNKQKLSQEEQIQALIAQKIAEMKAQQDTQEFERLSQQPQVSHQNLVESAKQIVSDSDESQPSFISTTNHGEGLEFNHQLGSIFDEIDKIKNMVEAKKVDDLNLEDAINLEEVNGKVSPLAVLIESIQNLDSVRSDISSLKDQQEEYLTVLRSIKLDYPITTCSHTLNVLIKEYQELTTNNDQLSEKINTLERQKFEADKEMTQMRLDRSLMQSNLIQMQDEINSLVKENKRNKQMVEVLKRQKDEQGYMQDDETKKIMADTQVFKDKIDKYKLELHQLRRRNRELENLNDMYEKLKERENERLKQEINAKAGVELDKLKEQRSIIAHIKGIEGQSIFTKETCQFLTASDILKLTCLNKQVSSVFLKHNQRLFVGIFHERTHELDTQVKDYKEKCDFQDQVIQRNETREKLRQQLVTDVNEERIRFILEKHVVKPQILQKQQKNIAQYQSGIVTSEMEHTLRSITQFMARYQEVIRQVQQLQARMLQQQQEHQQKVVQQQLNTSLSSIQETIAHQKAESYKLVKAGKKLVGALSYFGGFKAPATSTKQKPDQLEEFMPNQQQEPTQVQQEAALLELDSTSESKDQIPLHDVQQPIEEVKDLEQEKLELQQLMRLQQQQILDISINDIQVSEESIKQLSSLQTVEEMNEFLFKVGSYFVSDKQKLAQWIRGIQEGFAEFYIIAKHLYTETRELEILRDFLVQTVENLKLKVHDLMNEKEDMTAIHQSDSGIKEHLIQRVNELDKINMERSTELLFAKRKVQELADVKEQFDQKLESSVSEYNEYRQQVQKEIQQLKENSKKLHDENQVYKKALADMNLFFNKVQII